jgi:hypothetical protein
MNLEHELAHRPIRLRGHFERAAWLPLRAWGCPGLRSVASEDVDAISSARYCSIAEESMVDGIKRVQTRSHLRENRRNYPARNLTWTRTHTVD